MSKGSFILEGSTGKVGSVVVRRRQGSTVLSQYVKPSNPQTDRQLAQRIVFATVQQAAKYMKPIIDHSFEGYAPGNKSVLRFSQLNLDRLRGYSVIDFSETHSASDSKCFMTTKGVSALIPNNYIISQGSLTLQQNAKNGYKAIQGVVSVYPFMEGNTANYTEDGYTLANALNDLFGLTKPGQQLTKCYIICSTTNPRYVFANDPDSPGFVIAGARFVAARLVVKESADLSIDVHSMTAANLKSAIIAAFDTNKSDAMLLNWIDEAMETGEGSIDLGGGADTVDSMFGGGFCAAEATILSEFYGGSWLRSNSEMSLPNPPLQDQNYGLYWNSAVQAWREQMQNADSRLFLEQGGDQNQVGY